MKHPKMKQKGSVQAKSKSILVCGFIIVATFLSLSSTVVADWGHLSNTETHDGLAEEKINVSKLKWVTNLSLDRVSAVTRSPLIYNGKVIIINNDEEKDILYCLDLETGKGIWNLSVGDYFYQPSVDDGIIVLSTLHGNTYGISLEGKEIWNLSIHSTSSTISQGRVFLAGNNNIYCLYLKTGIEIWQTQIGKRPATPSIYMDYVFFGTMENCSVYALDKNSGTPLWSYQTENHDYNSMGSPAVSNDTIYFSSWQYDSENNSYIGHVTALNLSGNLLWNITIDAVPTKPSVAYGKVFFGTFDWSFEKERKDLKIYALNGSNGDIIWSVLGKTRGIPAISDHLVYIPISDYKLYAFHESNGTVIWKYDGFYGPASVQSYSSPAISNETLVIGGCSNDVIAFGPVEANGKNNGKSTDFFIPIAIITLVSIVIAIRFIAKSKRNEESP